LPTIGKETTMAKMRRARPENLEQYGKIKGGRTLSSRLPGIACLHMGLRGKRECPLPVTGVPLWSATRLAVSC